MEKTNNLKGYFYTLEALIAISLILISVVVIFSSVQTPSSSGVAIMERELTCDSNAFNCNKILSKSTGGMLANFVKLSVML